MQSVFTQHIEIPFDELCIFRDEDIYEKYLKETILLSTLIQMHYGKASYTCKLVITKLNVWIIQNLTKQICISINAIQSILKCNNYPQLVIITDNTQDNIRISTTSDERCRMIISAFSYIWTLFKGKKLPLYKINHHNLTYFQRNKKQKVKNNVSLKHYNKQQLQYYKPLKIRQIIFGNQNFPKKIIFPIKIDENQSYTLYSAQTQNNQRMGCYMIPFNEKTVQMITNHINYDNIISLKMAKWNEVKIQMFFQQLVDIKYANLSLQQCFRQISVLYNYLKQINKQIPFSTDILAFARGKVILRQFRYEFLTLNRQLNQLIYQETFRQVSKFQNKIHTIGVVFYQLRFGRCLYDIQCLQYLQHLKKNQSQIKFPKYLQIKISKVQKDFLSKCILMKFKSQDQLVNHPWLSKQIKL